MFWYCHKPDITNTINRGILFKSLSDIFCGTMKKCMLYSKINTTAILNHGDKSGKQTAGNCRVH